MEYKCGKGGDLTRAATGRLRRQPRRMRREVCAPVKARIPLLLTFLAAIIAAAMNGSGPWP
jgi:hypothetical protein